MTRSGLARHLPACPEREAAVRAANQQAGNVQTLYHLQVGDAAWGGYWLHLEMNSPPLCLLESVGQSHHPTTAES